MTLSSARLLWKKMRTFACRSARAELARGSCREDLYGHAGSAEQCWPRTAPDAVVGAPDRICTVFGSAVIAISASGTTAPFARTEERHRFASGVEDGEVRCKSELERMAADGRDIVTTTKSL